MRIETDTAFREMRRHGRDGYPFAFYFEDFFDFDAHSISWHWHEELELLTVQKGEVILSVGQERLTIEAGCGVFINSGVMHRLESADHVLVPNIVFSPSFIAPEGSLVRNRFVEPLLSSGMQFRLLSPDVGWQSDILLVLGRIYREASADGRELTVQALVLQLWDMLSSHADSGNAVRPKDRVGERLRMMLEFIYDHYADDISLEDIASAGFVSKSTALETFSRGISVSPAAYLSEYRLHMAADLLVSTELTVSEIAGRTGFDSSGYLCRCFRKRYGSSPVAYRKEHQPACGVKSSPLS